MNLGGWEHVRDGAELHVVPNDDLSPHKPVALSCWCGPARDLEDPLVIVHNAKDCREQYERGERAVS